jgi:hypothetical protein
MLEISLIVVMFVFISIFLFPVITYLWKMGNMLGMLLILVIVVSISICFFPVIDYLAYAIDYLIAEVF